MARTGDGMPLLIALTVVVIAIMANRKRYRRENQKRMNRDLAIRLRSREENDEVSGMQKTGRPSV
jgi:sensor domain CHASE-containing protein